MNIDLRNISEEFENEVNKVKSQFGINTNSKAVEICVVNYLSKIKTIESLRASLLDKERELLEIKNDVKTFTGSFSRLTKIT
jgi:hypothetical protein